MAGANLDLIYVQGCARSGTTLLKQLLAAGYENLELLPGEFHPQRALAAAAEIPTGHMAVASRSYQASLEMDRIEPRTRIVWLLRSPLDVLISKHPNKTDRGPGHFYVAPSRWVRSVELWRSWSSCPQVVTVRFEELIERPEWSQNRIANRLGLRIQRPFELCYRHFDRRPENVKPMGGVRMLDRSRIDRARSHPELVRHLYACFLENRELRQAAVEAGYDSFNQLRRWIAGGPSKPPSWWKPAMAT